MTRASALVAALALAATMAASAGANDGKGQDKVTICHNTHSESNPYVVITIAEPALKAHLEHGDFVLPASGSCDDGPDDDDDGGGDGGFET